MIIVRIFEVVEDRKAKIGCDRRYDIYELMGIKRDNEITLSAVTDFSL